MRWAQNHYDRSYLMGYKKIVSRMRTEVQSTQISNAVDFSETNNNMKIINKDAGIFG
jgi:hypothetical protein